MVAVRGSGRRVLTRPSCQAGVTLSAPAARRLAGSSSRLLMLTTFDMDEYVYAAMKAGACGFLLKDAPPKSLVDAPCM